ncbi:MAG: hypothetical protein COT09_01285 [Candidatus Hydromicrobium americanum]|nr:MAG: hypothetical protein COT09_01285 [Candidatus Hydromicrobium americanum]
MPSYRLKIPAKNEINSGNIKNTIAVIINVITPNTIPNMLLFNFISLSRPCLILAMLIIPYIMDTTAKAIAGLVRRRNTVDCSPYISKYV